MNSGTDSRHAVKDIYLCTSIMLRFLWFCLDSCQLDMSYLPLFCRVASLVLGQPYHCTTASDVAMKYMGKINQHQTTTKLRKT